MRFLPAALSVALSVAASLMIGCLEDSSPTTVSRSPEYLHWDFNAGQDTVLKEVTGQAEDGAIMGAQWAQGVKDGALYFNGIDNYVSIPYTRILDFTGAITIIALVKPEANGGYCPHILGKMERSAATSWEWNGPYWLPATGIGSLEWGFTYTNAVNNSNYQARDHWAPQGPSVGTWTVLGITFDTTSHAIKFYVDGGYAGTTIDSVNPVNNTLPLLFGTNNDQGNWHCFKGYIDDIRIYHKVITDSIMNVVSQQLLSPVPR
jgi:hypothetical protein